jgi:hypothetical protein
MALNTYFDFMEQAEKQRKFGSLKPEALMSLRASEATRLSAGAIPIDKAMAELASRGRMGIGPDLAPSASRDVAPLQGWAKMPIEVPSAMLADAGAPAPAVTAPDAGSTHPGTVHGAPPDGGTRHP